MKAYQIIAYQSNTRENSKQEEEEDGEEGGNWWLVTLYELNNCTFQSI